MEFEDEEGDFLEEAQRKAKQKFLIEEILDAGYSAELFTYFCEGDRGSDVDLWSFEELEEIVKVFKTKYKPGDEPPKRTPALQQEERKKGNPSSVSPVEIAHIPALPKTQGRPETLSDPVLPAHSPIDPLIASDQVKLLREKESLKELEPGNPEQTSPGPFATEKVLSEPQTVLELGQFASEPSRKSGSIADFISTPQLETLSINDLSAVSASEGCYSLPGRMLAETDLSRSANARIVLERYNLYRSELVPGGLLSSGYILYVVTTSPLNWTVKRQFRDFAWLRNVLQTQFPGYFVRVTQVPPIPPQRKTGTLSDDTTIKRLQFLRRFLETIAATPLFLRSQFLVTFLSECSNDQFQLVKKVRDTQTIAKLKPPEQTEDLPSLCETITCCPSLASEHFHVICDFLSHTEALKKKLKRQSEGLIAASKALAEQIDSFAETLKALSEVQDVVTQTQVQNNTYSSLTNAMNQWSRHQLELGQVCQEFLNMFFKYRYTELGALKDLLKDRDVALAVYLKSEEKLTAKKEKLWQLSDPGRWDLTADDLVQMQTLRQDKTLAFTKMLPTDTKQTKKTLDLYAYHNFQAKSQIERVLTQVNAIEADHFAEFSRVQEHFLLSLSLEWRTLCSKLTPVISD